METAPWYQSAIVRQQIVQLLVAGTALFGINLGAIDLDTTVASIFAGIGAVVAVWTLITRLFKPAPNLTQRAAAKEVELVEAGKIPPSPTGPKQGGFFRPGAAVLAFVLAAAALIAVPFMSGCAGTKAAYKAAASLSDTAYVVTEHYAAVVHEAADLAALPGTPANVKEALKQADNAVRPFIIGDQATGQPSLRELAARYQEVKDAQTEAQLQAAVDNAVRALANFINAVKAARR